MDKTEDPAIGILYVDDEELACKYFLRSVGGDYEVRAVTSADLAIAALKEGGSRIGVVVTDYRMPGRDGADLLRQIERDYPQVVRILITAYADKDLLLATVNSGEVFRILEKPFDLTEVRRALRLAVELSRERLSNRHKLMAINETLAFLAHELNTPLATIVNFSRGIVQRASGNGREGGASQAEIAKAAASVNENARYCLAVLSSFLDSVRNAGMRFGSDSGVGAAGLVATLLDTYPMTPEQRATITVEVAQDFRIIALPNCVALVLSSLLSNGLRALQSRTEGTLQIVVRAEGEAQIEVSDNGPGIPAHVLERLLVDPVTTHAAAGGSGRGMIFCHRIMQSFGGQLKIESRTGERTAITLVFPPARTPSKRSA